MGIVEDRINDDMRWLIVLLRNQRMSAARDLGTIELDTF
jgi:hypothetical protein